MAHKVGGVVYNQLLDQLGAMGDIELARALLGYFELNNVHDPLMLALVNNACGRLARSCEGPMEKDEIVAAMIALGMRMNPAMQQMRDAILKTATSEEKDRS